MDPKELKRMKRKKPRFLNLARWWHKACVKSWRRPRGIDNKQRLKLKSRPKMPTVGYRNPPSIRGLHPSGLRPVVVHNLRELEEAARFKDSVIVYIASGVGKRKRIQLNKAAEALGLRLANPLREEVEEVVS